MPVNEEKQNDPEHLLGVEAITVTDGAIEWELEAWVNGDDGSLSVREVNQEDDLGLGTLALFNHMGSGAYEMTSEMPPPPDGDVELAEYSEGEDE